MMNGNVETIFTKTGTNYAKIGQNFGGGGGVEK